MEKMSVPKQRLDELLLAAEIVIKAAAVSNKFTGVLLHKELFDSIRLLEIHVDNIRKEQADERKIKP
jgi:hypothetical protein